jgi:hypothetical protein
VVWIGRRHVGSEVASLPRSRRHERAPAGAFRRQCRLRLRTAPRLASHHTTSVLPQKQAPKRIGSTVPNTAVPSRARSRCRCVASS